MHLTARNKPTTYTFLSGYNTSALINTLHYLDWENPPLQFLSGWGTSRQCMWRLGTVL